MSESGFGNQLVPVPPSSCSLLSYLTHLQLDDIMATSQSTQDLAHARSQASFSPTAFHSLLRPGETSARRERVVEVLSKEKVFDKTHV